MAKKLLPQESPAAEPVGDSNEYKLPEVVAEKYEIVGKQVHGYFKGFGEIDMRQLTLKAAAALVKQGFPYLKAK